MQLPKNFTQPNEMYKTSQTNLPTCWSRGDDTICTGARHILTRLLQLSVIWIAKLYTGHSADGSECISSLDMSA